MVFCFIIIILAMFQNVMFCNIAQRWTFIIYSLQIQPSAFRAAFVGRAKCFQRVNVPRLFRAFQEPLNFHL